MDEREVAGAIKWQWWHICHHFSIFCQLQWTNIDSCAAVVVSGSCRCSRLFFLLKWLNTDSCVFVVVSNSCQHSRLTFFVLIPTVCTSLKRSATRQAFAGNTFYRLFSLPLTSVLINSYVNALDYVRRIARRGNFFDNPRHMSSTSSRWVRHINTTDHCELHTMRMAVLSWPTSF